MTADANVWIAVVVLVLLFIGLVWSGSQEAERDAGICDRCGNYGLEWERGDPAVALDDAYQCKVCGYRGGPATDVPALIAAAQRQEHRDPDARWHAITEPWRLATHALGEERAALSVDRARERGADRGLGSQRQALARAVTRLAVLAGDPKLSDRCAEVAATAGVEDDPGRVLAAAAPLQIELAWRLAADWAIRGVRVADHREAIGWMDAPARGLVLRLLAGSLTPRDVAALADRIPGDDARTVLAALMHHHRHAPDLEPALLELLGTEDEEVVGRVAGLLVEIGGPESLRRLDALQRFGPPAHRPQYAAALAVLQARLAKTGGHLSLAPEEPLEGALSEADDAEGRLSPTT